MTHSDRGPRGRYHEPFHQIPAENQLRCEQVLKLCGVHTMNGVTTETYERNRALIARLNCEMIDEWKPQMDPTTLMRAYRTQIHLLAHGARDLAAAAELTERLLQLETQYAAG